ncbi:hypothetical protein BB558_007532 [Smittium angustum]|uniref:CAAX prenyl protease 1 homolog n=1 Tax=Smittium angustum TaxID=133377 RepID=A0A2U1IUR7_SMIAN|nr:hypothetical protein BB558_007532 [Smittium angustum]
MTQETPKKSVISNRVLEEHTPKSEIDALVKIVKTTGFVDDMIDGIYLALLAICILACIFAAVLAPSLHEIFPSLMYVYYFFTAIPQFCLNLPSTIASIPSIISSIPSVITNIISPLPETPGFIQPFLATFAYKKWIIVFSCCAYIWETYLDIRQRDKLHEVDRPVKIRNLVTRKAFLEANSYGLDKSTLKFIQSFIEQVKVVYVLSYDVLPMIWYVIGNVMETKMGFGSEYEITHSILFFIATTLINSVLNVPFDLYGTFVVEEKHGFNKQTISLYLSDFFKTFALTASFGSLILSGLLWTIKRTGSSFYYYVMIFMMLVQLIGLTIFPTFIQPLFNKFTPLEEGELKTAIEALASRVDFPLKKLYVVDGSKRSSHSNAYMYGFFKNKRIVLFDTLIKQTNLQEVCAILAHELGHWKMNHVIRMLVVGQVQIFVIFYLFSLVIGQQKMYSDFGFTSQPVFIGFMIYQYLYQPVDSVLTYYFNKLSRKHEFEADEFSKKLGYGEHLVEGLIKIHLENKGNLNPDKLYSSYHYSHPPLVERLTALDDPNVSPKTE